MSWLYDSEDAILVIYRVRTPGEPRRFLHLRRRVEGDRRPGDKRDVISHPQCPVHPQPAVAVARPLRGRCEAVAKPQRRCHGVVPAVVELEVAVPRLAPAVR